MKIIYLSQIKICISGYKEQEHNSFIIQNAHLGHGAREDLYNQSKYIRTCSVNTVFTNKNRNPFYIRLFPLLNLPADKIYFCISVSLTYSSTLHMTAQSKHYILTTTLFYGNHTSLNSPCYWCMCSISGLTRLISFAWLRGLQELWFCCYVDWNIDKPTSGLLT